MTRKTKGRRSFTLLEIVICMAILAVASVGIGWQMKNMLAIHQFDQSINNFYTQLRKVQLIALSDRVDIDLKITKKNEGFEYCFHTDDPVPCFAYKPTKLTGIKEMKRGNKNLDNLQLHIYTSGRVGPEEKITFLQSEDTGVILDLTTPLCLELKRLHP